MRCYQVVHIVHAFVCVLYFSSVISWDWGYRWGPLTQFCSSWMFMKQGWSALSSSTVLYTNPLCSLSRWDWVWIQRKWGGRGRERLRGTQVWGRLGLPTTSLEWACSNCTLLWIYCSCLKKCTRSECITHIHTHWCVKFSLGRLLQTMQKSAYSLSYPPGGMALHSWPCFLVHVDME